MLAVYTFLELNLTTALCESMSPTHRVATLVARLQHSYAPDIHYSYAPDTHYSYVPDIQYSYAPDIH